GLILCKAEHAQSIDKAVFPGTQGGPLEHIIAAKAVALGEALKDDFKTYQKQVTLNAQALAEAMLAEGFDLISGGTDNHLMLVDLRPFGVTGKEMQHRLDEVHITANKNAIPNDPESPFVTSGLRLGTPAVTTRGFREEEMKRIAHWIKRTATEYEASKDEVTREVVELCRKYPIYD
ncbi:MAG: serine hydroxymethyltransferase, partial [Oscillospiraceae bacterium]|nr:serine hydroxymethyltransferase [Oscillospiraceae bacterium]